MIRLLCVCVLAALLAGCSTADSYRAELLGEPVATTSKLGKPLKVRGGVPRIIFSATLTNSWAEAIANYERGLHRASQVKGVQKRTVYEVVTEISDQTVTNVWIKFEYPHQRIVETYDTIDVITTEPPEEQ